MHHSGAGNTSGTNHDARRTEAAKRARREASGGNPHGSKRHGRRRRSEVGAHAAASCGRGRTCPCGARRKLRAVRTTVTMRCAWWQKMGVTVEAVQQEHRMLEG